jgi:hypothetical protein
MRTLLLTVLAGAVLAAPASAASVDVMVAGKRSVLVPAQKVTLKARSATVNGRRCALGKATPLSALAGAGVPFKVRDYGSCSRRARDAGSLYVQRIGADAARGRDGWVYKVGNRSGSAGAADPGGSFGTGRTLRDGDRVLWFWCVKDRRDACQRTLATTAHAAGGAVHVIVRGYDEQGRGKPVAGATVTIGGRTATTGASGTATLPVAAGRHRVEAAKAGLVPAFPRSVTVG